MRKSPTEAPPAQAPSDTGRDGPTGNTLYLLVVVNSPAEMAGRCHQDLFGLMGNAD